MSIVSKEQIEECKEKVKFSYDIEKVGEVIDKVAIEVGKTHKIKGYRKGKAPLEAIKQIAKKYIMDMAKQKLISEAYEDVLYETKWKPFGQPVVNEVVFNSKNFDIEMVLGHTPEFEIKQYKEFDLPKPPEGVTVESFKEKMKEGICQEFGDFNILDGEDFVLLGDEVCISYVGKLEGEEFKNNTGKDVKFVVGQGKAMKELEDEVIGMSVGENRDVLVTFPKDFQQKELGGKEVSFNVVLESARRKEATEFDEEVVKKAGFKDIESFDNAIELKANEKIAEYEFLHYREKINEKLLELNTIEVPEWMKVELSKNFAKMQDKKWEDIPEEEMGKMLDDANKKLILSFLLDKVKEREVEAVMSDEEIVGSINANLHRFPNEIREQLIKGKNPNLTGQIASEIQDEYLMRWLINKSVVTKEEEKVEEIVDAVIDEEVKTEEITLEEKDNA